MSEFSPERFRVDFGYLPAQPDGSPWGEEELRAAVAMAQAMYGLDPTGVLYPATQRIWKRTPRCGLPDQVGARHFTPKWGLKHLRYHIEYYPVGLNLTRADVTSIVSESFSDIAGSAC
jgi:hypothetical protein